MIVDYLIVGAGASAMSFLDVILAETEATVAVVDRRDMPGGHWNDAYPFVRLHQSSSFYGVPSRDLGLDRMTQSGYNAGLFELATKHEILHYYQDLMETEYLPSGRVQYFPMSEYEGNGVIRSMLSGAQTRVEVAGKVVQAGKLGDKASIPSTHTRSFDVADGVACIPLNDLPRQAARYEHFTVMGAGKTAMDAVLWLLARDVAPGQITWVRPNDYWIFQRDKIIPHPDFFDETMTAMVEELQSLSTAQTVEEHCRNMERIGKWFRIDPDHWPEKFHAATCSMIEMEAMRRVEDVVRLGHVKALQGDRMVLTKGEVPGKPNGVYVDCTASGGVILNDPTMRVFNGSEINLMMLRPFQPVFSAALIAHIEAVIDDEATKQKCTVITDFFNTAGESLAVQRQGFINQHIWNQIPDIKNWIERCRLNAGMHMMRGFDPTDAAKMQLVGQIGPLTGAAVAHIPKMLAQEV